MNDYYTALGNNRGDWPPVARHVGKAGVACRHDLLDGVPPEMLAADVWYADLPWRDGFDKFAQWAGTPQKGLYSDLLNRVAGDIRESGKPTCLVTGKHAVRSLTPQHVAPVSLNGGAAVACLWNMQPWGVVYDTTVLLKRFAQQYGTVADFCCGYGRAGRVFAQAGKRYIMSDFDAKCIGYIAAHEGGWA